VHDSSFDFKSSSVAEKGSYQVHLMNWRHGLDTKQNKTKKSMKTNSSTKVKAQFEVCLKDRH